MLGFARRAFAQGARRAGRWATANVAATGVKGAGVYAAAGAGDALGWLSRRSDMQLGAMGGSLLGGITGGATADDGFTGFAVGAGLGAAIGAGGIRGAKYVRKTMAKRAVKKGATLNSNQAVNRIKSSLRQGSALKGGELDRFNSMANMKPRTTHSRVKAEAARARRARVAAAGAKIPGVQGYRQNRILGAANRRFEQSMRPRPVIPSPRRSMSYERSFRAMFGNTI